MSNAADLYPDPVAHQLESENASITIARLRAAGEQLAAALRIAGACGRCKGEGEVEYHARGVHTDGERGPCPRCDGRRYLVGAMAALAGWEEAKGTI